MDLQRAFTPTGLLFLPSPPPQVQRWQDTCPSAGGCPARGLQFTEHSPACCGNNSGWRWEGEPKRGEEGVCLGVPPPRAVGEESQAGGVFAPPLPGGMGPTVFMDK